MEHLACFAPGMLALGTMHGGELDAAELASHKRLAVELTETCYMLYSEAPAGLAPDSIHFDASGYRVTAGKYSLRPETVESLFLMWRATHNQTYREWGWKIFASLQQNCRTSSGYAGLLNVQKTWASVAERHGNQEDSMPSFWTAETLKYLYLLFSDDDVLPLDQWVFNTEAHPLRVR
jgi:mannosyl-oligosaccharide alpha-1,2-mannosidase